MDKVTDERPLSQDKTGAELAPRDWAGKMINLLAKWFWLELHRNPVCDGNLNSFCVTKLHESYRIQTSFFFG